MLKFLIFPKSFHANFPKITPSFAITAYLYQTKSFKVYNNAFQYLSKCNISNLHLIRREKHISSEKKSFLKAQKKKKEKKCKIKKNSRGNERSEKKKDFTHPQIHETGIKETQNTGRRIPREFKRIFSTSFFPPRPLPPLPSPGSLSFSKYLFLPACILLGLILCKNFFTCIYIQVFSRMADES